MQFAISFKSELPRAEHTSYVFLFLSQYDDFSHLYLQTQGQGTKATQIYTFEMSPEL